MWPWSPARCPLDPSAKAWVEGRLNWLRTEFGDELFYERPLIQPTLEFFPELRSPESANLEQLFRRVCSYMGVERKRIQLEVVSKAGFIGLEDHAGRAVGEELAHYQWDEDGEHMRVRELTIEGPFEMVGVLAHELGHARLIGEGRMLGSELDHELATDLTALYHGFGLFLVHKPQTWISELDCWPGTRRSMPKYMNAHMYSWALAHQAWLGSQPRDWLGLLPGTARGSVKSSLRYLERTGDSALQSGAWEEWDALHAALRSPCDE